METIHRATTDAGIQQAFQLLYLDVNKHDASAQAMYDSATATLPDIQTLSAVSDLLESEIRTSPHAILVHEVLLSARPDIRDVMEKRIAFLKTNMTPYIEWHKRASQDTDIIDNVWIKAMTYYIMKNPQGNRSLIGITNSPNELNILQKGLQLASVTHYLEHEIPSIPSV